MVWNQVKVPRHNLNTFCLEIVCKYMYFFKVKILYSTDGSTVQLLTDRHVQIYQITHQNNILFYLMIWYRNWKNIVHQNMDTPEENSVTQINKDKTLTARILSQSVCFFICYVHDKYILLWFYEFMINCCFFCYEKSRIIQLWCLEIKKEFL